MQTRIDKAVNEAMAKQVPSPPSPNRVRLPGKIPVPGLELVQFGAITTRKSTEAVEVGACWDDDASRWLQMWPDRLTIRLYAMQIGLTFAYDLMEYSARVGGGEGEMEAFGYLFLDVDLHGLTSNHTLADCDGRFSVTEVTLSGVIRNHKEGGEWSDALALLTCHGPPPADWRGSFPRPRGMLHDVNERLGRELPALQDRVRKARALCVLLCLLVLLGAALLHLSCTRVDFDGREPGKTSLRVVLQRWQGRTRGRLLAALCWLDCTMLALLALLLCTAVVLASRRAFEQPQIAPPPPPYTCDCSWTETYSCPGTASPPPPPPPPAAFRFSLDEATWRDAFGDVSDLFHPHATPDHSHCFAFCCPGGAHTRGFWSLVPKSFRTGLLFGGEGA